MGLCLLDVQTRRVIDLLGVSHDRKVIEWVESLKVTTSLNQVSISLIL